MSEGQKRWSAADLERVRALAQVHLAATPLPPRTVAPPAETAPSSFGPAIKRAAVLSRFRFDALESDAGETELLRNASVAVREPMGPGWRSLVPDVRSTVLSHLERAEIETLVESNAQPGDPLQTALRAVLAGIGADELLRLDADQLSALVQVHDGLAPVIPGLPPRPAMERKLELVRLLEPLRTLTASFSGRENELQALRDYVGVLPPASWLGAAKRLVAATFFSQRKPPFLVAGPGGVGKTTLVARFILEHALVGQEMQFPFAYLDFDRPTVMAEEPATLLVEAVRQIGLQYETAAEPAERLRQRWEQRLRSTDMTQSSKGAQVPLGEAFVGDFVSFLTTLQVSDGPVLLVLDTFEEVQLRSTSYARGVVALVDLLAESISRLRVVIAGRAEIPGVELGGVIELREFDRASAVGYLKAKGVEGATAEAIAKQVGGSPLALNLALLLYRRNPEEIRARGLGLDGTELKAGVVQAQIFDRILLHIVDEDVRKLVNPGLALRRVTPELIREVLAGPCGVDVPDDARAQELFEKLWSDVTLFTPDPQGVLVHRPELRRVMLGPLREGWPRKVDEIHRGAVAYYARSRRGDLVARAEEVYHRLALGQSRQEIGPISRDLAPYLRTALEELPPSEQAILAEALGFELSPEAAHAADQETWERDASRRVKELLKTGDHAAAEKVLEERGDRSAATDLRVSEALLLGRLGKLEEARTVASAGIEAYRQAGNAPALFSMLLLAVDNEESIGDVEAASRYLDQAEEIARRREDPFLLMRALVSRCALRRAVGEPVEDAVREELAALATRTGDTEWSVDPSLLRDVVAEVGADEPGLVERAVKLGAIDPSRSQLEATLGPATPSLEALQVGPSRPTEQFWKSQDVANSVVRMLREEDEQRHKQRPRRSSSPATTGRRPVLRLKSADRRQLADLLTRHLGDGLGSFLELRLDRSLEALTFAQTVASQAHDVVAAADFEGWLAELVVALRRSRFDDPGILHFCDSQDMGPTVLEASSSNAVPLRRLRALLAEHRGKLGAVETRTCTIELGGEVRGCGFLVGPDLVLTASDVVTMAPSPKALTFRFDRITVDGRTVAEGEVRSLRPMDPLVRRTETHVILRIDDELGSKPVDGSRADPGARTRGFVVPSGERRLASGAVLWLWRDPHGTFLTGVAATSQHEGPFGWVVVDAPSSPAAAGAPCLDGNLDVVALFAGSVDPKRSRVLPLSALELPAGAGVGCAGSWVV